MTGNNEHPSRQSVVCSICSVPLPLETSRTDEHGKGVHEQCYVRKTISALRANSAIQLPENWFDSMIVRLQRKLGVIANN